LSAGDYKPRFSARLACRVWPCRRQSGTSGWRSITCGYKGRISNSAGCTHARWHDPRNVDGMLDSNSRTRYSETVISRRRERGISSSSKRLQKIWSSASHKWYALQRTRLSVCMDPDTIETPRSTRSALWVAQLISLAYETLWWTRLCKVGVR
jgi:hypothetical protein